MSPVLIMTSYFDAIQLRLHGLDDSVHDKSEFALKVLEVSSV
jgi:hypothetical protein